jgi:hypothetical protein
MKGKRERRRKTNIRKKNRKVRMRRRLNMRRERDEGLKDMKKGEEEFEKEVDKK